MCVFIRYLSLCKEATPQSKYGTQNTFLLDLPHTTLDNKKRLQLSNEKGNQNVSDRVFKLGTFKFLNIKLNTLDLVLYLKKIQAWLFSICYIIRQICPLLKLNDSVMNISPSIDLSALKDNPITNRFRWKRDGSC